MKRIYLESIAHAYGRIEDVYYAYHNQLSEAAVQRETEIELHGLVPAVRFLLPNAPYENMQNLHDELVEFGEEFCLFTGQRLVVKEEQHG